MRMVDWAVSLWGRREVRYASVSVLNIAVTQGVILIGSVLGFAPVWANVLGTGVAAVVAFLVYRNWVWRDQNAGSVRAQTLVFTVLVGVGLLLSSLVVQGLVLLNVPHAAGVGNILGFGLVWVLRYLALDRLLFKKADAPSAADKEPVTVGR